MASSTILSRKIIKPSSPIPSSLRHHNLSFRDYIANPSYVPVASFYSKPENYNMTQISYILENSLSKILSSYYPFAGRIKDNKYVDCNDDDIGIEYLNVRVNCPMSEILNNPNNDAIDIVFPQDLPWNNSISSGRSLLVVQLSHFDCGGLAVSLCLSHKIADGYSLSKFLFDWADISRDEHSDIKLSPHFNAASFFPLMDNPPNIPNIVPEPQRCVSRMYHISSSNLTRLKDIVATNSGIVQNPTRVEVATALLHKCGVAASKANPGVFKPTMLIHLMNLRPPIPLNTIGNATCHYGTMAVSEDDINLTNYVARLQKAKQKLQDELKGMNTNQLAADALTRIKQGADIIKRDIFDVYSCTSLCNIDLHKHVDFGWGRPVRLSVARYSMKNHFLFMDERSGDGINVVVTLTEADMSIFQNNEELLEFASPVGSVPRIS
ncbi:acylsugar acyltransferase 3-like [Capsicum galapagoense]